MRGGPGAFYLLQTRGEALILQPDRTDSVLPAQFLRPGFFLSVSCRGLPSLDLLCKRLENMFQAKSYAPILGHRSSMKGVGMKHASSGVRMGRCGGEMSLSSAGWRSEALLLPISEAKPRSVDRSRGLS